MTIGRSGSSMTDFASSVSRAGAAGMPRSVVVSRSAIATTSMGRPARRAISARWARSTFTTPAPIVPKPISPTLTGAATLRGCDLSPGAGANPGREPAGERAADATHRLAGAVLVLDEREAHVVVAVLAEADAGRDRDLGLLEEELRELERAHRLESVRDLGPHEHRRLGLRHVPAEAT